MTFIHIDPIDKRPDIPAMGEGKTCEREGCSKDKWETSYGLAGGGMGVYNFCSLCERVVEKDVDPESLGETE